MKKQSNVILGFVLVLIIVLFAVLNNKNVPVSFGFTSFSAPLILVIIGSALILKYTHCIFDCFGNTMAAKKANQTADSGNVRISNRTSKEN
ncbi:hypothetical protein EfmJHP35_13960 [Enterococcus faecium]|nr:hypothetical protein EfmJHP35_13960 [Enterococcus faecium]